MKNVKIRYNRDITYLFVAFMGFKNGRCFLPQKSHLSAIILAKERGLGGPLGAAFEQEGAAAFLVEKPVGIFWWKMSKHPVDFGRNIQTTSN